MSGTVAVVAGDTGRYTMFSVCLTQLRTPVNTSVDWGLSTDISGARNALVERALERGSEWVFFIDDDHVYPRDLLMRLLSHELPMVCSLYLRRAGQFDPVAYSHRNPETKLYESIDLTECGREGLIPIYAAGAAGMLIRSEVFRAIEPPWFEHGRVLDRDWNASEDIIFCEKVNEAGFEIFLDLEANLGHCAPCAIWPSWVDEEWSVGFSVSDTLRIYYPIEKSAEAAAEADAVRR